MSDFEKYVENKKELLIKGEAPQSVDKVDIVLVYTLFNASGDGQEFPQPD